jgi:hypothetical protein
MPMNANIAGVGNFFGISLRKDLNVLIVIVAKNVKGLKLFIKKASLSWP